MNNREHFLSQVLLDRPIYRIPQQPAVKRLLRCIRYEQRQERVRRGLAESTISRQG